MAQNKDLNLGEIDGEKLKEFIKLLRGIAEAESIALLKHYKPISELGYPFLALTTATIALATVMSESCVECLDIATTVDKCRLSDEKRGEYCERIYTAAMMEYKKILKEEQDDGRRRRAAKSN